MKIPQNAFQIVIELAEEADDFMGELGVVLSEDSSLQISIGVKKRLKVFWDSIFLLPFRWASMNPLKYKYGVLKAKNKYYFVFSSIDINDNDTESIDFEIPIELYEFYLDLSCPFQNIDNPSDNDLYYAFCLCEEIVSKFYPFSRRLKIVSELSRTVQNDDAPKDQMPRLADSGRTIICKKGSYTFTKTQSRIIILFWENYKMGNGYISEQDALEKVDNSRSSFENIFRSRKEQFKAIFENHESEKDLWRLNLEG